MLILLPEARAADLTPRARAAGFAEKTVYHSPETPGFAAWVQLWREPSGSLMLKFIERRTDPAKPPTTVPADLHKWETVGLPPVYEFSNLVTEAVFMRSGDEAATWKELGTRPENELGRGPDSGCLSPVSLPDGRLLDITWGMPGSLRQSRDMGRSWQVIRELMDPKYYDVAPFVMRLLRDNKTLIIFCPYMHAWGPGTDYPTRLAGKPGVRAAYNASLFWSDDFGKTLHGPIPIYPNVPVTETDFCELPSGDLLFVHAQMFGGGKSHRQLIRRTKYGFVPEEMEDCGPEAPEIFVRTNDGYLVGASRNGPYYWSDDDGTSWYPLDGASNCGYQPRATLLKDGRVLFAWHRGGDLGYKEADQWIGQHTFRLEVLQPRQRTMLKLARVYDEKQKQYICAFQATLTTQEGKPLKDQPVEFSIVGRDEPGYQPFGGATPWVHGKKATATTNADGIARIDYPEQQSITDIHKSFQVCARFNPDRRIAGYMPATSVVMEYYAVTPRGR